MRIALGTIDVSVRQQPFVIDIALQRRLTRAFRELYDATWKVLRGGGEGWRGLVSSAKVLRVLEKGLPFAEFLGSYRPDFLFGEDGSIHICEVNARFTLNGFLLSMDCGAAVDRGEFGEFLAAGVTHRTAEMLREVFPEREIVAVSGREELHDLALLGDRLPDRRVVHVKPEALCVRRGDGRLMASGVGEVRQCVLELHQEELEALGEEVLEELMRLSLERRCLNPLWTIFIVHDKRFLGSVAGCLPEEHRDVVVPTATVVTAEAVRALGQWGGGRVVLKPALRGKGQGIVIGGAGEVCGAVGRQPEGPWVVQPYVRQKRWDQLAEGNKIVGTMLCMNDVFIGAGIFRSNSTELVALSSGGFALAPVQEPPARPLVRVGSACRCSEEEVRRVRQALEEGGVALVALERRALSSAEFEAFVARLGARSRDHNGDGSHVWTICPSGESGARSHTAEEFSCHTDASYEAVPPRYFALFVERADWKGGGYTSIVRLTDALAALSDEERTTLRRTSVRWTVPIEFRVAGGPQFAEGPVLFSETQGRFRRDIIDTSHLPGDVAGAFWRALDKLDEQLKSLCAANAHILPEHCVLLLDNWTHVHSRSKILDCNRKLLRVRFDLRHDHLPVVTKGDLLRAEGSRTSGAAPLKSQAGLYWSPSGGSSTGGLGSPERCALPCAHEENSALRAAFSKELRLKGAFPGCVAVNLMSCGKMYRSLEVFQDACVRAGLTELPLAFGASDDLVAACMREFDVSVVVGFPSRILQLAAHMRDSGLPPHLGVRSIIYGGERFPDSQRRFVRAAFPNARFFGAYGSSETGVFACTEADSDVYSYPCDAVRVELLSSEGGEEESGGVGRIVVTNLLRKTFPIVRYDTGDVGRRAGLHGFTVDGRDEGSGTFPLGLFNLDFNTVKDSCFRGVLREDDQLIVAQIWISAPSDGVNKVQLALYAESEASLLDERKLACMKDKLAALLAGTGIDSGVALVKSLSDLKRSERSGKLLQFVDSR